MVKVAVGGDQRREEKMGDAKEALDRDWEQTKHDLPRMEGQDLDQDVDDTVKQAAGKEEPPPDGMPNRDLPIHTPYPARSSGPERDRPLGGSARTRRGTS